MSPQNVILVMPEVPSTFTVRDDIAVYSTIQVKILLVLIWHKGPIYMVNLLKLKDKAECKDGRETRPTGMAAFELI